MYFNFKNFTGEDAPGLLQETTFGGPRSLKSCIRPSSRNGPIVIDNFGYFGESFTFFPLTLLVLQDTQQ